MKLMHYMKKENSGLARSTLELVKYEGKQGHDTAIKEPGEGGMIWGKMDSPDIELIHSQLPIKSYFNGCPKIMWQHGEPLSSVGNGISMKAIVDLAAKMDALICMRKDEVAVWSSIKRTYLVPKGIDLELYKPLEGVTERLSGAPAVLYIENWRGNRNPLYLCVAMQKVWKKYPDARLHLYNCQDKKMLECFRALIAHNKWWPFIRSLQGATNDVNLLYNRVDMVVSCLYPLYARGIEAFGANKAFIGPGYKEHDYPFTCEFHPDSMADTIINCWENYDKVNYRKWAETHHDVNETVKQSIDIYNRYL
jgi:glycosyltransferase involved in cell wall biosynthesis